VNGDAVNVSVSDLARELPGGAYVLDVREPEEFVEGHVPGARLMPMATVPGRLPEIPRDRPVYVVCAVGGRSFAATRWLIAQGVDARNVAGGTSEWAAAGLPLEAGDAGAG
jgi:rhodanese-related sulfurtransferase